MFRQTLIRACIRRQLKGGASNDKDNDSLVHFTLVGDNDKIEEILQFLRSGKELNDWGAKVETLIEHKQGVLGYPFVSQCFSFFSS
jgi:acylphosphatase